MSVVGQGKRSKGAAREVRYIERRGRTYYAVREIPKDVRNLVDKVRMVESLKTDSLIEAKRRVYAVIAKWELEWELLRKQKSPLEERIISEAISDAARLNSKSDAERGEFIDHLCEYSHELKNEYGEKIADMYYNIAIKGDRLITELFATWQLETQKDYTNQTHSQHSVAFRELIGWAGEKTTIRTLDRARAGVFVTEILIPSGKARKTVKRYLSSLSAFWTWAKSRGHANENPWKEQLPRQGKARSTMQSAEGRRELTDAQLIALLSAPAVGRYGDILVDLVRLALCSGARLDELCSLTVDDCFRNEAGWWFKVRSGKTEAAKRIVPIHDWVVPIFLRRIGSRTSGPIFEGLKSAGRDGKPSAYVTKAYKTFRSKAGVTGNLQDFHAIRNTFIGSMEAAGVPGNIVKLIVGHARQDQTYGGYSKGARVDLRPYIEKLRYEEPIPSLITISSEI